MTRAERITAVVVTLLKDKPKYKAYELVKLFECAGWQLAKDEKQLIYGIVKGR